jgi:uncharacterized protein (DUF488 family)
VYFLRPPVSLTDGILHSSLNSCGKVDILRNAFKHFRVKIISMKEPNVNDKSVIWTVGHSTRTIDEFINLLLAYNIELLADIRSYPGSKRYPHFNKNQLCISLAGNHIEYLHIPELGGKRKPAGVTAHAEWKNVSFRAYADYMDTDTFYKGITILKNISKVKRTAIMCAEALWWKCHRRLVSDYMSKQGIEVIHIFDELKSDTHKELSPQEEIQDSLFGEKTESC